LAGPQNTRAGLPSTVRTPGLHAAASEEAGATAAAAATSATDAASMPSSKRTVDLMRDTLERAACRFVGRATDSAVVRENERYE
jgi:hypothetical protein